MLCSTQREKPGSPGRLYWFGAGVRLGYSQDGPLGTTLGRTVQHPTGPFAELSYPSASGTQERSTLLPLTHLWGLCTHRFPLPHQETLAPLTPAPRPRRGYPLALQFKARSQNACVPIPDPPQATGGPLLHTHRALPGGRCQAGLHLVSLTLLRSWDNCCSRT